MNHSLPTPTGSLAPKSTNSLIKSFAISFAFLALSITGASAQGNGFFESYVVLDAGSGNQFYDATATTANPDFHNANLGAFNCVETLLLGGQGKAFKCSPCDVTGTRIFWRVWSVAPSGSFTQVNMPFASNDPGAAPGCQDQTWQEAGAGKVNVLAGLIPGNYTLEVYFEGNATGSGCPNPFYHSNSGSNYQATFEVSGCAQGNGFFESSVVLDAGSGNQFYDATATTANPDFHNANLGAFNCTETLLLGGQGKAFKCSPCDVTGTRIFWRVWSVAPSGSFTQVNMPFASNDPGAAPGCQDQTWQEAGAGKVNVLAGLIPGNYTLEVYFEGNATGSGCPNPFYHSNSGSNYQATFEVSASGNVVTNINTGKSSVPSKPPSTMRRP